MSKVDDPEPHVHSKLDTLHSLVKPAGSSSSTTTASFSHQLGSGRKKTYKIIVIGDSGVGKTCLTFRFCSGHFPGSTEATIGVDFREKMIKIDKEEIRLQLWDTAGQERFRKSMVAHYYRNVSGVILVYDVTRRSTFQAMRFWVNECEKHGLLNSSNPVPMLMVGNKCEDGVKMEVNTNEAQRFADGFNIPLFETSAKDDTRSDHVDAIFMTLAHKVKQNKPLMKDIKSNKEDPTTHNTTRILYQNQSHVESSGFCC